MKNLLFITFISSIAIAIFYFVSGKKANKNDVILDFAEYALGGI